jgi:hypothetical protein
MGEIQDRDYETVTARCDECDYLNIFNRIDDIGEPGPYSGRDVTCLECGKTFWIFGDIINPAYQLFIFNADEHMRRKHYMLSVTMLGQAWESFFATFIYSNYLYRPFNANARYPGDLKQFNRLAALLGDTIEKFTFDPLRNVLVNTVVERVHPDTLDESETAIARIKDEKFGQRPAAARVEAFPDAPVRDVLLRLRNLRINELRNRVVHKEAYRPRRAEVEACRDDEIRVMYRTRRLLPVRTFDEWRAALRSSRPA